MENTNLTMLYSLAAIWIALQEGITATFGKSVESASNRILKEMIPQMHPDAANLCRDLVEFTASDQRPSPMDGELNRIIRSMLLH
jgi:hypothetical protein